MEIEALLSGRGRDGAARDVEAALLKDGHLVLTGPRLACVGAALAAWSGFAALPLELRQGYHQSVRAGEARGLRAARPRLVVTRGGGGLADGAARA